MKLTVLQLKVWKLDHRIFWAIYIGLQLFIIACILYCLITESWVKLDLSKSEGKDFDSFKGGLSKLTEYDGEDSDASYDDKKDYYCNFNQTGTANLYKVWCDMFTDLPAAGSAFILFDVLSMASLVAWGVILIAFSYSVNCFFCSFVCSTGSCLLHYAAFLLWIFEVNGVYNGDCNDIAKHYSNGQSTRNLEKPNLCIGSGPGMATFLLVFIPLVVISFMPIGITAYRNKRRKDREGEPGVLELPGLNLFPAPNQGVQNPVLPPRFTPVMHTGASYTPYFPIEPIQSPNQYIDPSTQPNQSGNSSYPVLQKNII